MHHEFKYTINLDDIDYMGVVGHANWLLILQRARVDLLEALGGSIEALTQAGIVAVVSEVAIRYLRPARHRDNVKVRVLPEELSKTSVLLDYTVTNAAEARLVTAKLRIVFVGSNGRPVSIPEHIRTALERATLNESK